MKRLPSNTKSGTSNAGFIIVLAFFAIVAMLVIIGLCNGGGEIKADDHAKAIITLQNLGLHPNPDYRK